MSLRNKILWIIGISLAASTGINTGVAVAGVIGTKKFIYDLWGMR